MTSDVHFRCYIYSYPKIIHIAFWTRTDLFKSLFTVLQNDLQYDTLFE